MENEVLGKAFNPLDRVFDLSRIDKVAKQLADVMVVSHCAGPRWLNAEAMMKA
jgi:short subunit dehydrogenase-like uncharacterized protein